VQILVFVLILDIQHNVVAAFHLHHMSHRLIRQRAKEPDHTHTHTHTHTHGRQKPSGFSLPEKEITKTQRHRPPSTKWTRHTDIRHTHTNIRQTVGFSLPEEEMTKTQRRRLPSTLRRVESAPRSINCSEKRCRNCTEKERERDRERQREREVEEGEKEMEWKCR
jgi:hypothetical protein